MSLIHGALAIRRGPLALMRIDLVACRWVKPRISRAAVL